jgi:hypothetical protein
MTCPPAGVFNLTSAMRSQSMKLHENKRIEDLDDVAV